jgi:GT2 family glycosyltransferase
MSPLFSVVLPTYNRADLLMRAVASVRNQSLQDFELIIVDDGSTTFPAAAIDGLGDRRVITLRNGKNMGVAVARNLGIDAAKGHYISFLDDDDEYVNTFLESTHARLRGTAPRVAASWCGVRFQEYLVNTAQVAASTAVREFPVAYDDPDSLFQEFLSIGSGFGLTVKSECLRTIGGFDASLRVVEDSELFLRLLSAEFVPTPVPGVHVVVHNHLGHHLTDVSLHSDRIEEIQALLIRYSDFLERNPALRFQLTSTIRHLRAQLQGDREQPGARHPYSAGGRKMNGGRSSGNHSLPLAPSQRRTFTEFRTDLLAAESGLDPDMFSWYAANYEKPLITYWRVTRPGRAARHPLTGDFEPLAMTVREYFTALGVEHLFDPRAGESLRLMQYSVVNMLGFVGYQFGEFVLKKHGYYVPELVARTIDGVEQQCERYYIGTLPNQAWRNCVTEVVCRPGQSASFVVASDVNYWKGTFTGRNGVTSLQTLMVPETQDRVLTDILLAEYAEIERHLRTAGLALSAFLDKEIRVPKGEGVGTWCQITASGLFAASHLCGARATADFLINGTVPCDETGTSLTDYLRRFRGYETPAD